MKSKALKIKGLVAKLSIGKMYIKEPSLRRTIEQDKDVEKGQQNSSKREQLF